MDRVVQVRRGVAVGLVSRVWVTRFGQRSKQQADNHRPFRLYRTYLSRFYSFPPYVAQSGR